MQGRNRRHGRDACKQYGDEMPCEVHESVDSLIEFLTSMTVEAMMIDDAKKTDQSFAARVFTDK
jgi:hypothetical protein